MDENKDLGNRPENGASPDDTYIADPAWDQIDSLNPKKEAEQQDAGQEAEAPQPDTDEPAPNGENADAAPEGGMEAVAQAVEPVPQPAGGAPVPTKPKNKSMLILVGVVAILIIAIIAVLVGGGLGKKPEDAVADAIAKTNGEMQKLSEQLMELPFYKMMMPKPEAHAGSFSFSIGEMDLGDDMEAGIIANMMKLFSLSGDTVTDPSAGLYEVNGKVNMGSTELVNYFLQLSPGQLAFHIPKFSDTVLSINPDNLVNDVKGSPLYSPYMDDATLQQMQDGVNMLLQYFTLMGRLDPYQMQDDILGITKGFYVNAVYDKAVREDNQKVYVVHLDGEQVRSTIIALAQYIYLDSEIGQMYQGELRQMMQDMIVGMLEENLPPLPTDMTVKVGRNGLLTAVLYDVDVSQMPEDQEMTFSQLSISYVLGDDLRTLAMDVSTAGEQSGEPFAVNMDMTADYHDGCKGNVVMSMDTGVELDMTMDMNFDQAGAAEISMDYTMNDDPYSASVQMLMSGTVTEEAGVLKWDFPTLKMTVDPEATAESTLPEIVIGFKANGERKPLDAPAQPVSGAKPLFSMTEEELAAEMAKYSNGVNSLAETFLGAFLGSGAA